MKPLTVWIFASAVLVGTAAADETWWSFQPPVRPSVPDVELEDRAENPIDRFVLARLEADGIEPSPRADRPRQLRRVSLDLTGLLPTPEEFAAFMADSQPCAYSRLVDRLLESPHYGERWGRHWLDVARYADSVGGEMDTPRPMWHYRDWLIDALNRDLPFDDFVIEQLAGDLIREATDDQITATGFMRCGIYDKLKGNGSNEIARLETVVDRVNTTGSVFLGLTIGCAQCHTHKFDPISIDEYYEIFALFNDVEDAYLGMPTMAHHARYEATREQIDALEKEIKTYEERARGQLLRWEIGLTAEERAALSPEVQVILEIGKEIRTPAQAALIFKVFLEHDPGWLQRRSLIDRLDQEFPEVDLVPVTYARSEPRKTTVFERGDVNSPGKEVQPGVPAVLPRPAVTTDQRMTRLDFARWMVREDHPLTARVMVNRVWQHYFGQGLVSSESDFGVRGAQPSHPRLLDWLARELVDGGWSLKRLHRLIVTSSTYRQSSVLRADLARTDSENNLLARQSRLRLEAESIRDVALAASGMLATKIGGPSVFPHQPDGIMEGRASPMKWEVSEGEDRYRRGMYTYFWRLTPHPFLRTFDAPEAITTCTRRYRSNTPLQALTLLNDHTFVESAVGMAARVLAASGDDSARIDFAVKIAVCRVPRAEEAALLLDLLAARRQEFAAAPERARQFLKLEEKNSLNGSVLVERASWTAVCRALLNLDEVITRG
jgi:hypothetical protein